MPSISNFGNVYARPPVKNSSTTSSTHKQPAIRFGMNHPAGDTVSFDKAPPLSQGKIDYYVKSLARAVYRDNLHWVRSEINALAKYSPLQRSAIINQPYDDMHFGDTPLHVAVQKENLEVVQFLLEHGALESVNKGNKYGQTPLHHAARSGNLEVVQLLSEHGALESVNKEDNGGSTPLYQAASSGNLEVVQFLSDHGALESVNKPNKHGMTPLHYAACSRNPKVVKFLLEKGALESINKTDDRGNTPLRGLIRPRVKLGLAIESVASYDIMGILLAHGANPDDLYDNYHHLALITHLDKTRSHHTKTLLNPQATPEQKQEATQWFKLFPPNGGAWNWEKQMSTQLEKANQWFQLFPLKGGARNWEQLPTEQFDWVSLDKETDLQSPTTAEAQHQAEEPRRKVWLADNEHEK